MSHKSAITNLKIDDPLISFSSRSGICNFSSKRFTVIKWWRNNKSMVTAQKLGGIDA